MSDYLKFCPNCRKKVNENDSSVKAYTPFFGNDDYECRRCHGRLIDTKITSKEFGIIYKVSNTIGFLEAMIKLYNEDPVEYQLKMSQFKTQLAQQESSKKKNDNIPRCPTCNSTNLSKISTAKKATKIGLFGIFGAGDVGKTWKCNNCGSKF